MRHRSVCIVRERDVAVREFMLIMTLWPGKRMLKFLKAAKPRH